MSQPGEQATTPSSKQGSPPPPAVSQVPPVQPTVPPVQPTVPPVQPTVPPVQPTVPPVQPTVPPALPTVPPALPTVPPVQPTIPQRQPKKKPTELSLDDSGTPLLEQSDSDKSCSISPSDDREMAISPPPLRDDLPAYTSLTSVETSEPSGVDLLADPQPSTSTGYRGGGFIPHFLARGQQSSSSDSISEKAPAFPDASRRFSVPFAAAEAPSLPESSLGSSDFTSMSSMDEPSMAKRAPDSGGGSSRASVQHSSESDVPMSSPSLARDRKVGSGATTGASTPSEMSPAHGKGAAVPGIPKRLLKRPPGTAQGEGADEPDDSEMGTTSPVPAEPDEILDVHMSSPVPSSVEPADEEEKTAVEAPLEAQSSDPAVGAPGDTQETAEQRTQEAAKAEDTRTSYERERDERGAREAEALKHLKERAAAEKAELLSEHASQTAARKSKNGAAEAKFVAERDRPVPKGEEWKRVSEMCDLRQNAPHREKDVSRYRAVLSDLSQGGVQVPSKPEDSADPESAAMAVDAPAGTSSASTSPTPPPES